VFLQPVRMRASLVTNAQWLDFMADGGYGRRRCGSRTAGRRSRRTAGARPGYGARPTGGGLADAGRSQSRSSSTRPVTHAELLRGGCVCTSGAGKDLPTETELEVAARSGLIDDAYGIVWQWTRSAPTPAYPGYRARPARSVKQRKLMINQMCCAGSWHATPDGHTRRAIGISFYSAGALAIQRAAARRLRGLNSRIFWSDQGTLDHEYPGPHCPPRTGYPGIVICARVVAGLTARPKRLSPKYFYDEAGRACSKRSPSCPNIIRRAARSRSFSAHGPDIGQLLPTRSALIEFGSGSTRKDPNPAARPRPSRLCAVDISAEIAGCRNPAQLQPRRPRLKVLAVAADFTAPSVLPRHFPAGARRLLPGLDHRQISRPHQASAFLQHAAPHAGPGAMLIIRRRSRQGRQNLISRL